ncbi:hypothetical protein [Halomonas sp. M20]|uniref:hypothetical protein n=1 Tax=Halomonas sp. M20 TaxID=2763264 RepID=UPI001D0B1C54|nr:hypothetical protein [Halomonas sp. M20]
MIATSSSDQIGFRAMCLRGIAYILLVTAMMEGVFYATTSQAAGRFTEYGITEIAQSLFLLIATALAIVARAIDRALVSQVSLLLIALLGASLIREQDSWLDEHIFDGAWQILVSLLVIPILFIMIRQRKAFALQFERLANTFAFGMFAAGFLTVYVFSRLFGRSELWKAVLGERYLRIFKDAVEETAELFGYTLLMIAMFELVLLIRRWQRTLPAR